MDQATRDRLEAAGFEETTVKQLFGLTDEENDLIETRLALARLIKILRQERRMSQVALARQLKSDQGNVSKAENSDSSVSIEWMIRAAFALGANRRQVGNAIGGD